MNTTLKTDEREGLETCLQWSTEHDSREVA